MANASIYAAFERMWQQTLSKLGNKADKTYVDSQITEANKYTDESVANLLNNSSEAVDSIYELRDAMEDNADAIGALTEIAGKKVDKVDGKGLSTNDYTTEEKNKLANLKTIVGDTPVSTQISTALNDYAPDWNKMQNKPFYSEIVEGVPEFDGDLTKEEVYDLNGGKLIRKSDTPLSMEELIGSIAIIEINAPALGVDGDYTMQFDLTEDNLNLSKLDDDNYSILIVNNEIEVPVGLVIHGDMSELYGTAIPEGVYYMYMSEKILGTTGSYCYTTYMSCLYGPMEEIHPIDEKYLPDTVATKDYVKQLVGSGTADSVDWSDIENKPFGEETITLVDNLTIPIQSEGFAQIEPPFTLVAGQEYIVIYNGTEYKVTAKEIIDNGVTVVFVGNQLEVNGEDTGEPFTIGYVETVETMTSIIALDGSTEVVLTVIGTEVKTIDKKYLPEPLQFGETLINDEKIIKPLEVKYLPEHLQFGQTLIDGDTLTWDGERSGLTVVEYLGELWYHVSDSTPTMDDLANGGGIFAKTITAGEDLEEQPLDSSMIREDNGMISIMDGYIEIIPEDNFTDGARTYPKAGTYFKWDSRYDIYICSLTINDYNGYGKIVDTIDKKYLPPFIEKKAALLNLNPVGSGSFSMNREADTETGIYSVALGWRPTASGPYSYAEGYLATASGFVSHAEGYCTTANGVYSHVQGKYNIADEENKYAHIVGNGESSYNSNAHTLDWRGNAWFAGDVYVGSTLGSNKDEGSKKLATEEFVNQSLQNFTSGTQVQILTWEAND